jgi:hypothetical protein
MEVAFWELAPYFPNVHPSDLTPKYVNEFIRINAGRGLHLSTFRLNVRSFSGIRWVHVFPPIY